MHAKASRYSSGKAIGRVRHWLLSYPKAIPAAIFLAVAVISVLSVYAIESNARQSERAQLREVAVSIAASLSHEAKDSVAYLRAGAALFSSRDAIEVSLFRQFARELDIDPSSQSAQGVGWAQVDDSDEQALVTGFVPETGQRDEDAGFDLYSDPVRRAAMIEATRERSPTASGTVQLAYGSDPAARGFAIFMPVLAEGNGADVPASFLFIPFHAAKLLDVASEQVPDKEISVRLYDGDAAPANLLASHSSLAAGGVSVTEQIELANRQFALVVDAPRSGFLTPMSYVALLFGLAVASLLMLLARLLASQAAEDQARIDFFEEQYSIRNSLTRELNHRVKNTLANVLSILSLTRRRANDIDEFTEGFEGRIRALSATHDLLTHSQWGTTAISAIIEAELAHVSAAQEHTVEFEGPPVELAPNDALTFGQAIHELATNAAKFGALSGQDGKVSINWRLIEPHLAEVEWRETGGPPVNQTRGRGFGTELIEKIVAHELRQPVALEFEQDGVRCVLRVAVRRREDFRMREQY